MQPLYSLDNYQFRVNSFINLPQNMWNSFNYMAKITIDNFNIRRNILLTISYIIIAILLSALIYLVITRLRQDNKMSQTGLNKQIKTNPFNKFKNSSYIVVLVALLGITGIVIDNMPTEPKIVTYLANNGIGITNTNLVAKPIKANQLNNLFNDKISKDAFTTSLNDFSIYVKPYSKLSESNKQDKEIKLGVIKNNKLQLTNNKYAKTFAVYAKYIKKHHLEKVFNHDAYLVYSTKYLDQKGKPQLILTTNNDHPYVLYQDKKVKLSQPDINV